MSNLCIIPARGGSKRIPRKNIRDFLGKPMISYVIELAVESGLFDEIMVSTEDEEVAKIAQDCGASVPFLRSKDNANDLATTADCIAEVLDNYRSKFDWVCCIYPTAVLAQQADINDGLKKIKLQNLDSVFPVVSFDYPIWRGLKISDKEKIEMIWPKYLRSRSQDLQKVYHDAGQWYWFNPESFKKQKKLFMNNSGFIEKERLEVQDIDTYEDLKLAKLKFSSLREKLT
ncbi:pseudaminic acid cytidylyltransferase [Alteromonas halophila]|uniref:Pseudaminic acid cytidylyltransferase n=1 Tax=Alteromonas halophila TaxID=516698 RepID=A0A918JC52_9ALTE|nr:pseudaminic acid cytidylyltransferase [Alteromonas halophila]GGW73531.1 pseudaminic acid cytidylyltransferase [Alteromonas halophila]